MNKKEEGSSHQDHHGVVQRAISVHRLHLSVHDVMPLHAQVNEAPALHLLAFPIEDVVASSLVLDGCPAHHTFASSERGAVGEEKKN